MKAKTALVTGASSGIGRELARCHAAGGGHLVLVARRYGHLMALKEELEQAYQVQVMVIAKDLAEPEAPYEIYQEIKAAGTEIDYLINNAGFGGRGIFAEQDSGLLQEMIQVNTAALTLLTSLFLPDFIRRNSGRIMNVSSIAALMPGPLQAVYFATKAYVNSFGAALTEELKHTNITVTTIMPGTVATEFAMRSNMSETAMFAAAWPSAKVAEFAYSQMLRGRQAAITGVSGMFRLLLHSIPFVPKRLVLNLVYRMQS